ncbi:mediator of RNA polymerase II transcription subunit 21-like [Watersipora subatra]|uniref:mediator of RNA polymerase II transcription subunit 21-like n=1 Tax=Watersipora subatra TaxID=2589382 RepID=UPI00355C4164
MADRLTQLQDAVNQMAEHFTNSIGFLQQTALPSSFQEMDKVSASPTAPQEDFALLFAKLISRTAKDIDYLVDHLPNEESSMELQMSALQRLEVENDQAARNLEKVVKAGEEQLEQIQKALSDIAQAQLTLQALENQETDDQPPS